MRTTLRQPVRQTKRHRITLTAALTLYGAALGAAAVLISLLVSSNPSKVPTHLPIVPSIYFALGGSLAAVILVFPIARWMSKRAILPRGIFTWLLWGFGFGILLPLLTGGLIPESMVLIQHHQGLIATQRLFSEMVDALFRGPLSVFVYGATSTFTGIVTGVIFSLGAWIIDKFNVSSNSLLSRFVPWIVVVLIGTMAIAVAVFGPAETLAKLG